MQIFVSPSKLKSAGMWVDIVTHTAVEIQHQIVMSKVSNGKSSK